MTEEEFFNAWQSHFETNADPADLAISAGRLCTPPEPAFIFTAGYQAAIRATFTEIVSNQWFAYAASEDRSEGQRKPGVTIESDHLYGVKTWVAASKYVGELIVKVGSGEKSRFVKVSAHAPGVNITHKPAPRFLPKLSQGEAEFNGAEFAELQDLSLISGFADCESYYIYLALLASLSNYGSSANDDSAPPAFSQRANVILQTHKGSRHNLGKLDKAVQALLTSSEPDIVSLLSACGDDAKLFSMYSKGIQVRHGEPG